MVEMGWVGQRLSLSGCSLSHCPSCSEDASLLDPPKDVTEAAHSKEVNKPVIL